MKKVFLAGATGSIGESTLSIIKENSDKFKLSCFTAHSNHEKALRIIEEFKPEYAIITNKESFEKIKDLNTDTKILSGMEECSRLLSNEKYDLVLNSIVGGAGLEVTYHTVLNQKRLCLANKESLVIGGDLVNRIIKKTGCEMIPVDSEHSAIFQCLHREKKEYVQKLWLTASGGPFFKREKDFDLITVEEALKHPNWSMGSKITIDSATLMNKGLEVIEAYHLFNIDFDKIFVIVHPQSVIHSMVEFIDGNVLAQLGATDMKGPIALSFDYPEKNPVNTHKFDMFKISKYSFYRPDFNKFPCLRLAYQAGKKGSGACIVLNAANESAVRLFLEKKIKFTHIPLLIEEMLATENLNNIEDIQQIIHTHEKVMKNTLKKAEKFINA